MWRVVCLDEKLLNEVDIILVSQKGQPLFKSHICLRLICEFGKFLCSSRGYLILQIQRFCAHAAWSLRSDGREHGGRGFRTGRTRLSTAHMTNFRESVQTSTTCRNRLIEVVACGPLGAHSVYVP